MLFRLGAPNPPVAELVELLPALPLLHVGGEERCGAGRAQGLQRAGGALHQGASNVFEAGLPCPTGALQVGGSRKAHPTAMAIGCHGIPGLLQGHELGALCPCRCQQRLLVCCRGLTRVADL